MDNVSMHSFVTVPGIYLANGLVIELNSIVRSTNIVIETDRIDCYEQIEAIMDQLGTETELLKYMR